MLALEEYLIKDIAARLKVNGEITATAREHILALMRTGYDMKSVAKALSQMTGIAESEIQKAMLTVLQDAGLYYKGLYEACGSGIDPTAALQQDIDAIMRTTDLEMKNISRSLGFAVRSGGQITWMNPAEAYQHVLDEALVKVNQGVSYNQAIHDAVRQLADSGLQTVTYINEDCKKKRHVNRADVAVRRSVMTGVTKLSQAYADQACDDLDTPYIEVTAHAGARDNDRPNPWSNHKAWQGKVYSKKIDDIYPSVFLECGLGEVDGLCGANCRHGYHPFIPGVTQRTYTDDELKNIDKPPFQYGGKTYSSYEASQVMRKTETTLRALKRRMLGFSASGDRDAYTTTAARYKATKAEYKRFADAAGMRNQMDSRSYIYEWGPKEERAAEKALQDAAREAAENTERN